MRPGELHLRATVQGPDIDHIFKKIREHPQVLAYLPEEQDWGRLPRQFICNIAHTIIGKSFSQ